jgi:hypothetical protein
MNTTAVISSGPQTAPTPQAKSASSTRTDDLRGSTQAESSPEQRDAFELALRKKSSRRDEDDPQHEPQSDTAAAALLAALAGGGPHTLRNAAPVAAPPPAPVETSATGARAAIEAALNANTAPLVTPIGATDPAALWEASIAEPNGVAVNVRALRAEQLTPQAQPSWTVAVSSSTVDAGVLGQHAPRLNERLRKHGVGFSHVRIEGDQEQAE